MPVEINGRLCYLNSNNRLNVLSTFGPDMILVDETNNTIVPLSETGETAIGLHDSVKYSLVQRKELFEALARVEFFEDSPAQKESNKIESSLAELKLQWENESVQTSKLVEGLAARVDVLHDKISELQKGTNNDSKEPEEDFIFSNPKQEEKSLKEEVKIEEPNSKKEDSPIVLEGLLEKKGQARRNWNQRWFVLQHAQLSYYKKKDDPKSIKGNVSLYDASILSHAEKNGQEMPFVFAVRNSERDFIMRAKTAEQKDEWIAALRKCILKTPKK